MDFHCDKTITENEIRRNENSFQEKPISLHNIVYVKPADRQQGQSHLSSPLNGSDGKVIFSEFEIKIASSLEGNKVRPPSPDHSYPGLREGGRGNDGEEDGENLKREGGKERQREREGVSGVNQQQSSKKKYWADEKCLLDPLVITLRRAGSGEHRGERGENVTGHRR